MRKDRARDRCRLAALGSAVSAEILEQVLVKVNGEIVTKTEFEKIQILAMRELPNHPESVEDVGCRAPADAGAGHAAGHRDAHRRDAAVAAGQGARHGDDRRAVQRGARVDKEGQQARERRAVRGGAQERGPHARTAQADIEQADADRSGAATRDRQPHRRDRDGGARVL